SSWPASSPARTGTCARSPSCPTCSRAASARCSCRRRSTRSAGKGSRPRAFPSPSTTTGPTTSTGGSGSSCGRSSRRTRGCVLPRGWGCPLDGRRRSRAEGRQVTLAACLLLAAVSAPAGPAPSAALAGAGLYVVVPPAGPAEPELGWIAEAVADALPRALERAGLHAVDRADRLRAQDALGVPHGPVSRATSIR